MHNPAAGRGRPSKAELVAAVRAAGYEPVYHSSAERDFADLVLDDPGDLVIAAGGDGTVTKVAFNLIGRGVPVAVVPLGTANNVAHCLGVAGPFAEVVALWGRSAPRAVDLGRARGPWGETCFLEAAGGGVFPRAMRAAAEREARGEREPAPSRAAELRRDVQRLRSLVASASAERWTLALDGRDLSGDYLLFEAMNLPRLGPGLELAPATDPADGQLDLLLAGEAERSALVAYLDACRAPACGGGPPAPPELPTVRGRRLEIAWRGGALHADSELWPWPPASFPDDGPVTVELSVEPRAVPFLLPDPVLPGI